MELFTLISLQAFLLAPFMCYFLFFKKNEGRSLYSGRDLFYPIKYYLARKVVKAAQEKCRRRRKKLIEKNLEPEIAFPSQQGSYYQSFSGCDQKGNSLKLKFTLKPNKVAEIILVLKLANGSVYAFPGSERVFITSIKENRWKTNGLIIENLEPYKRLRIAYNGLLQNISFKNCEKVKHVQFNFIFNCCSSPRFYPEDCDTSLITETLATTTWKDASWKKFLKDHPDGYEQFGVLMGVIKGDSFPDDQVLNLPACRSRYGGTDDKFLFDREIKIFVAESYGVLISLTLKSLDEKHSQLSYGYVCHKQFKTIPISGQDIRIQNIGKNKILPDVFIGRIKANSDEYTCAFNINQTCVCTHEPSAGNDVFNAYAECDVNVSKGRALLEFQYLEHNRNENPIKLKPILTEKKVEVLPEGFVVNIKEKNAKILEITGGKGNSLALLSSLKSDEFIVPDGFIITVNAFKRQLAQSKLLQDAVKNVDNAFCGRSDAKREDVCTLAVRLFTNEPVYPEIAKDIIEGLKQVKKESAGDAIDVVSWAVRSSAIGEDSEELSAAGQNETILGCVTESEILKAVSRCWASLFAYQSVHYRWQHGIPINADMAVVVQKMVPAERAGVLFTWHPTNSNPSQMVIISNFGLGESVVSGKSDPDTFILNRTHDGKVCVLDQIIGAKDKVLTLTENGVKEITMAQGGSCAFVNGKDVAENWSLTKEQVLKLGRIGVALEEAFGGPRDIEWAFYKNDLYLLQSRPITTLNTWTDWELTHEFDTAVVTQHSLFTIANTGEVFPVALTALGRSHFLYSVEEGMQKYINLEFEPYFFKSISIFQYRVMLDCILCLYINQREDNVPMETKVLDLAIIGHPLINEKINHIIRTRLGPLPKFNTLRSTLRRWIDSRKIETYVKTSIEFVNKIDLEIKDDDDIHTIFNKIATNNSLEPPSYYHSLATSSSIFWQMICMITLIGKQNELTTTHYADFANILSSCDNVESAEVPLYLERIAKIIRNEGYSEEFCTIKHELGMNWLEAKCPAAYKVFLEFLERHGHRCIGEFEVMSDTWALNPSQVIPMIQANVRHLKESLKEHKSIDEVINDLESPVNVITKEILKYTLGKLRTAVGKREQSKSALIKAIHKFRLAYRRLASQMVHEGLLPSESLIFHLTKFELSEVLKNRNPLLISKAIKRQKLYWKWNNLKFPEISYGIPEPEHELQTPVELLPGTKCTGTPVCTGSVQARACVITHLDQIGLLEKGDILITFSTDIGWSPYFPMLSGVVTEIGGLVSHGAVVAREYGLPCIVGVKHVTKIFKTGDIVYLSGKTGELGKV